MASGRTQRFLAIVGSGLAISVVPGALGLSTAYEVWKLRREWTLAGPPCPAFPTASPDPKYGRLKRTTNYLGAAFGYTSGMAYCADIPKPGLLASGTYQVCQFNNPNLLRVETDREARAFGPLRGHRATVTVKDGAIACVVGGGFDGH